MKISAIIPAAGSGSRYNHTKNKLLEKLKGIPVIAHTLMKISSVEEIDEIIVCTSEDLKEKIAEIAEKYKIPKIKKIILGGKNRQQSVFNGLLELEQPDTLKFALIHDGARPLVSAGIIKEAIETAVKKGASIVAVPTKDTIKRIDSSTGEVIETIERQELWNVQTPQVFKTNEILGVHQGFKDESLTDDAALMEKAGYKIFVCMGSYKNIKITTEEDFKIAESFMDSEVK